MLFLIYAVYSTPNYFIRLSDTNQMLSRYGTSVVSSDFYTPILFEFTQASNGDLFLKDIIKKKSLTTNVDSLALEIPKGPFSTSFEIIYNGGSSFYIMKDDKCLEAENAPVTSFMSKVSFKKCENKAAQLWNILFSGDRKIFVKHAYIPNKNFHMKRHNHIFFNKNNPTVKKHSSFMIYHPKIKEDYTVEHVHDIPLTIKEAYEPAIFYN